MIPPHFAEARCIVENWPEWKRNIWHSLFAQQETEMEEHIQRFRPYLDWGTCDGETPATGMQFFDDGDWVTFRDHARILQQAREEATKAEGCPECPDCEDSHRCGQWGRGAIDDPLSSAAGGKPFHAVLCQWEPGEVNPVERLDELAARCRDKIASPVGGDGLAWLAVADPRQRFATFLGALLEMAQ